jgi:hypothetical protein
MLFSHSRGTACYLIVYYSGVDASSCHDVILVPRASFLALITENDERLKDFTVSWMKME